MTRHLRTLAPMTLVGLLVGWSLAACSNLDRSRDIGDSQVSGRTLAQQVCANCHGLHGEAQSPNFPKLAGQQRQYLIDQLTDFRDHKRSDPAAQTYMWGFTHLSDGQIAELADYFSGQTVAAASGADGSDEGPSSPELIEQGRLIFTQGVPQRQIPACASCHGEQARGQGPFPQLAGQHIPYVVKQFETFTRGDERPRGAVMSMIGHQLEHHEVRALAAYVASLKPATSAP